MEKNNLAVVLIAGFMLIFSASLIFVVSFISAADLNLKVSGQMNGLSADFYAITDINANSTYDGYDMGSQPLQSNDSRLFSWCNPGAAPSASNATCSLVIDSWPASSRVFYLVYTVSPSSSGTLNIAWNSSLFGIYYNASLTDYGANSTYSSGANASSPLDMKTNESYSASFSASRYLLMNITYFYCGDGRCDSAIGENCSTCSSDCGSCGGGGPGPGPAAPPEVTCTPVCPAPSQIACGQSLGSDGCGGTCSGTGTECGTGEECSNNVCVQVGCTTNTQCEDQNPCTNDRCLNFECDYSEYSTGSCDDGNACSTGDKCDSGTCKAGPRKECNTGEFCRDGDCIEGEPLPVEDVPTNALGTCESGCAPSYICGDFGKCSAEYDINQLISGTDVKGVRAQQCTDKNDCCDDFSNIEDCSLKEDVTVKASTWCGEEYTELVDAGGKVVARMKKTSGGESISVDLNAAGSGYCAYCYDLAKDGDEEGIDCGGSCDECGISFEEYKAPLYNIAQLLTALGFFLFFTSSFIFIFADLALYIKDIFLLKRLGRKFSYWKREGYDVDVLEADLHKAEKSFEYKFHKHK